MKQSVFILLISTVIGCSPSSIPLKGSYQLIPYRIETTESFEKTWSKLIDFFVQKGIGISTENKSSGLIISKEISFRTSYTYEDKDGNLKKPGAFVVVRGNIPPNHISGNWNVVIEQDNNKIIINVHLVNLSASYHEPGAFYT